MKIKISDLSVRPDLPTLDAIAVLTRTARKIIVVTDASEELLGIVTDYDVRKAILNHIDLGRPVSDIMNKRPVTVRQGLPDQELFQLFEERRCHYFPVVDEGGKVVDIRFFDELVHFQPPQPRNIAVIMAGGLGTRLRPMTEHVPKPLLTVGDRPLLFILLDQVLSEGFERIFISLNYKSDMIMNAIRGVARYRNHVEFLLEQKPLGTAGSLSLLPERPEKSFAVINGDLLTNVSLTEMIRFHEAERNDVTVAIKRERHVIPYGVADISGSQIVDLKEKPEFVFHLNTGVYVLRPDVLDRIPKDGFLNMTDVVKNLIGERRRVGGYPLHEYWLDVGTPDQYERAQMDYLSRFK